MVVLVYYVLHIFHDSPRLSMLEVGHTSEGTVTNWLEISVPPKGRIVLVKLLEVVLGSPDLIFVVAISWLVLHNILVDHLLIIYIIIVTQHSQ